MPAESKKQFKAMQAAAHGKSTLGIPKKVGQDFVATTPKGSYKSLPESKTHLSPHNANVTMQVGSQSDAGAGMKMLHCTGDNGASATLPLDVTEAQNYPVGSTLTLHCVPSSEEETAQENQQEGGQEEPGQGTTNDTGSKWDSFFSKYDNKGG